MTDRWAGTRGGAIPPPDMRVGELKSTNPKDLVGIKKVPLSLIPATARAHIAMAFKDGAVKYGKANWRIEGVSAQVYIDACLRHLDDWYDGGEESAEDSGVHHLGHAAACLCILIDSQMYGNLVDDRPTPAPVSEIHKALQVGYWGPMEEEKQDNSNHSKKGEQ